MLGTLSESRRCGTLPSLAASAPSYLQDIDQNHGVGHMTIKLLLLGSKGQVDEGPGYNPRSSIEEQLEVKPLPDARVELDSHHIVVEEIACEFAVFSIGGEQVALDHCECGYGIAQDVGTP